MNKQNSIPENESETLDYLNSSAGQLDEQRLSGLKEAKDTQQVKNEVLQREQNRLALKHGADHPAVIQTQARLSSNEQMFVGLDKEIERSETGTMDQGTWRVQGKVLDSQGNPLAGLLVFFADKDQNEIEALDNSTTDDLGNYSITLDEKALGSIANGQPLFLSISYNERIIYSPSESLFASPGSIVYQDIYLEMVGMTYTPSLTRGNLGTPGKDVQTFSVTGKITGSKDEPLGGLTVRVYDADPVSSDDPLGVATTSASGIYKISFKTSDYGVKGTEKTGPDIYIRAYSKETLLGESKIMKNSTTSSVINLKIDPAVK